MTVPGVVGAPPHNREVPLYAPATPLIGRRDDLDRLRRALDLTGGGGIVLLSGDAGIGKSRLLAAAAHAVAEEGVLVVAGYCVGLAGAAPAYLPFADLVGELAAAEPDAVAQVAAAHPALGRLLPGLGAEASTAPDVPPDPARMAAAVHACLEAVARRRPLLAVVEDVHWADNSSRDLLSVLFTRGFSAPVGLVASYRSDDLHRRHPLYETLGVWARLPRVTRFELGALPDDDMRTLVAGLAGAPGDPAVVADVVERAEGNAFFAEELVAGGATVSGDLGRVLWLRVDSLGEDARAVVRTMAVAGRSVSADLLGAVTDWDPGALDAALREALDRQLVVRADADLAFRHALLAETSYDDLLPAERTRLHAAYAAALLSRPDLGTDADLARHSHAAGDDEVAVAAAVRAGQEAMRVGGPADGLAHYERALGWLAADDPDRDRITELAAGAATASGNTLRAFLLIKDRIEHPGASQTAQQRAGLLALLALKARILDSPFDALGTTAEALELLPADAPPHLQCRVRLARLQALVDDYRYAESLALTDEITRLAEVYELPRVGTEARAILGRVIEAEKDTAAMGAHLEAVRAELTGLDDPVLIRVCHNLAGVYHRGGDLRRARAMLAEGREVAERRHRPWAPWATECRLLEGVYSFELGDWERAARLLDLPVAMVSDVSQALIAAGGLVLRVARGESISETELSMLGRWWPYDGLVTLLTCVGGVESLAASGDPLGAARLLNAGIDTLDRLWGTDYQGVVRLTAVGVGGIASPIATTPGPSASTAGPSATTAVPEPAVPEIVSLLAPLVGRAAGRVAQSDHYVGAESRAWALRLAADWCRLLRRLGAGAGPTAATALAEARALAPAAEDEVAAWRAAQAAMAAYGHGYETARCRARLAEALAAAGDLAGAATEAAAARSVAEALGARALLAELDALTRGSSSGLDTETAPGAGTADGPSTGGVTRAASPLTARELEVLALLALGRTNGQIGKELFISTKTASVHVSNILAKLGAQTRGAAAAEGARRGLL